jgi:hypothetical protein
MKVITKRSIGILAIAAITVVLSVLAGCAAAEEDSIEDIINNFIAGINAQDIEAIVECLDPVSVSTGTASDLNYWKTYFSAPPYTITSFTETSDTTATVTFTPSVGAALTWYFRMTDAGNTYFIKQIDDNADLMSPFFQ